MEQVPSVLGYFSIVKDVIEVTGHERAVVIGLFRSEREPNVIELVRILELDVSAVFFQIGVLHVELHFFQNSICRTLDLLLPLHLITGCGAASFLAALIVGIVSIVRLAMGRVVTGLTGAVILLLFLSGLIMVGLGIIGYYLAKIYDEVKRRPRYVIAETLDGAP